MGIRTVMITGDNPLTARAIAEESGVDDFLAEATPEDKMALIRKEQEGGKLVAMTGDGTNDAPALAQADVGVAMNTGTSAAKEAGNMVDLDSNPTKLIEIVEIGKQLLITRGALTTFSIANDVAKYFAIIPAMFAGVFPGLDKLNIMHLHSPESAIASAIIFNALIIVALIPLALRGVRYKPSSATRDAPQEPVDLRRRRPDHPVRLHQAHRPHHHEHPRIQVIHVNRLPTTRQAAHRGVPRAARVHRALRDHLPRGHVGRGPGRVQEPGQRVAGHLQRQGRRVFALCQEFVDAKGNPLPQYFQPRPSNASSSSVKNDYGCDANYSGAANLGPNNTTLLKTVQQLQQQIAAFDHVKVSQIPPDAVTGSGSGLDPDISPQYAAIQVNRVAAARHLPVSQVQALVSKYTQGRNIGFLGEPRVNVLNLNIALDELPGQAQYAQAGA